MNKGKLLLDTLKEVREEKEAEMAKTGTIVTGMPKVRDGENGQEKWCPACATYFPANLEHFYKDGRGKLGLSSWCQVCQREKKKDQEDPEPTDADLGAIILDEGIDAPFLDDAMVLELDFSDYPQLLENVRETAVTKFRPVDMQALALISTALERMDADNA